LSLKRLAKLSPTSWLTTKTVFAQVFALLLFAIQAPLLGPRAFGLVSIVMVFIGFCESVLCEAAADALISVRDIQPRHFETMTAANVLVSLACGAVVFFGAAAYASLFHDAELVPILRWMSVLPVISALAAAPTAAAKRDMQFQHLALRSIVSTVAGGAVGLILTVSGAGVWALVWQAIATRVVAAWVLWWSVPLSLRFGLSRRHFADLIAFAAPTLLSRTMMWVTSGMPRFVLGVYWGPADLGLFSLACRLGDILTEVTLVPRYAVARVELRRYALDREGLNDAVARLLRQMSMYCLPLCAGGAAAAPTLFHAWLDPRWYGGIAAAQLTFLMCMASTTHYSIGAALLALNHQRSEALTPTIQTFLTMLIVPVAAPFGVTCVAAALAARPLVLLPLPAILLRRKCGVPVRTIAQAQIPILMAASVMGVLVVLLRLMLEPRLSSLATLAILVLAGAGLYALLGSMWVPELRAQVLKPFVLRS
jgi:O-antigen/teichoic acid export membrane protein